MSNHRASIDHLHRLFCELTEIPLRLTRVRLEAWVAFIEAGFTEDDLRLVIRWVRYMIKRTENYTIRSLMFNNFFEERGGDYLWKFEERLPLARAELRKRAQNPPRPAVTPQTRPDGRGGTITTLEPTPMLERGSMEMGDAVKSTLQDFRRKMGRVG